MRMIKFASEVLHRHIISKSRFYFAKASNDNNKNAEQRNENYYRSKNPVNKIPSKQQIRNQINQINFNDARDLRFLLLGNALLMGGLPFWAPLNIGICVLNGGYIMSRIGVETKKVLLLINNNQLDSLSSYRPLDDYLKLIFGNVVILGVQCLILASNSFEISSMFSMLWVGLSVKQSILSSHFYLILIPLFISIFFNLFSDTIRCFLLNQPAPSVQQAQKKQ